MLLSYGSEDFFWNGCEEDLLGYPLLEFGIFGLGIMIAFWHGVDVSGIAFWSLG